MCFWMCVLPCIVPFSNHLLGEEKIVGIYSCGIYEKLAVLWHAICRGTFFQPGAVQCRNVITCDEVMEKAILSLYTARAFPLVRECNAVYHCDASDASWWRPCGFLLKITPSYVANLMQQRNQCIDCFWSKT